MNCITCQGELKTRDQKKFCSTSCAAKYNNVLKPKRRSTRSQKCKGCETIVYPNKHSTLAAYCSKCKEQKKHNRNGVDRSELTIEQMVVREGSNRYDQIRTHAHTLYKTERANPSCQCCGYDKHIELCHIHSIASFPKDTKLKIVNARENILFLCPNCHWEFDHEVLTLQEIESAPGRTCTGNLTIMRTTTTFVA